MAGINLESCVNLPIVTGRRCLVAVQVSSPQPPVMYQEIDGVDDSSPVRVASAAEQISNVFRLDDTSTSGASEPIRVSSDDQRYRRELHRMSQVYREKLLKDTHRQAVQQWQANSVIMEADRERERQLHLSQLRAAAVEASVKTWMNDILRDFNKRRDGRKALGTLTNPRNCCALSANL